MARGRSLRKNTSGELEMSKENGIASDVAILLPNVVVSDETIFLPDVTVLDEAILLPNVVVSDEEMPSHTLLQLSSKIWLQ